MKLTALSAIYLFLEVSFKSNFNKRFEVLKKRSILGTQVSHNHSLKRDLNHLPLSFQKPLLPF
jgi:hypothetical protein